MQSGCLLCPAPCTSSMLREGAAAAPLGRARLPALMLNFHHCRFKRSSPCCHEAVSDAGDCSHSAMLGRNILTPPSRGNVFQG